MKRRFHPNYPDVWRVVARIPRGAVATYGQIAEILGIPGRARFIGYALHALPRGTTVPWHRVVNARGNVSLPAGSGRTQIALLAEEGVSIPPAGIDLQRRQWKPAGRRRGSPARTRPPESGRNRG
jgi:methylated-DNA-protein-cysteine methyltransferase-like protein